MRTIAEIECEMRTTWYIIDDRSRNGIPFMPYVQEYKNLRLELYETITHSVPQDRLKEICQAERDGRCVVVPTKPFEKAYVPVPLGDGIMEVVIQRYELCENGCSGVLKADGNWRFDVSIIKATQEEAEAALKGGHQ